MEPSPEKPQLPGSAQKKLRQEQWQYVVQASSVLLLFQTPHTASAVRMYASRKNPLLLFMCDRVYVQRAAVMSTVYALCVSSVCAKNVKDGQGPPFQVKKRESRSICICVCMCVCANVCATVCACV